METFLLSITNDASVAKSSGHSAALILVSVGHNLLLFLILILTPSGSVASRPSFSPTPVAFPSHSSSLGPPHVTSKVEVPQGSSLSPLLLYAVSPDDITRSHEWNTVQMASDSLIWSKTPVGTPVCIVSERADLICLSSALDPFQTYLIPTPSYSTQKLRTHLWFLLSWSPTSIPSSLSPKTSAFKIYLNSTHLSPMSLPLTTACKTTTVTHQTVSQHPGWCLHPWLQLSIKSILHESARIISLSGNSTVPF